MDTSRRRQPHGGLLADTGALACSPWEDGADESLARLRSSRPDDDGSGGPPDRSHRPAVAPAPADPGRAPDRARTRAGAGPGSSNFSRAHVPWGVDLTAAWAWRFLVIAAAGVPDRQGPRVPDGDRAARRGGDVHRRPRRAGGQLRCSGAASPRGARGRADGRAGHRHGGRPANGGRQPGRQRRPGPRRLGEWRASGRSPTGSRTARCYASDSQINDYLDRAQEAISNFAKDGETSQASPRSVPPSVTSLAGFFIVLFSTYFFLADGERIWVRFRQAVAAGVAGCWSTDPVGWPGLAASQFVRATVIVAAYRRPRVDDRGRRSWACRS